MTSESSSFERRRGKIALTRNGKLFLTYVERVLDELDNGISQVRAAEHAEHDQIRVVSSQLDFISEILRENYPKDEKIKIKQVRCANLDVFDRVLSDDADFAFTTESPSRKCWNILRSFLASGSRSCTRSTLWPGQVTFLFHSWKGSR